MKQRPKDDNQLQNLVVDEIADKWDSIAIHLRFDPVEIKIIKQNHQPCPVDSACREMLLNWKRENFTSPSNLEPDLIKAVKDVGFGALAEMFRNGLKL